jgi:hypothetical protein|nr:discoidin domain-containing protein [Candidatus Krumholzibacteria bacterium]
MKWWGFLLILLAAGCGGGPVPLGEPRSWQAFPADGVQLDLSDDAGALRLDFNFSGGGYAIARREVDLDLPPNYEFRFRVRGDAPPNHLEFKLVDDSGENVWWHVRRDVNWPSGYEVFTIKKRQVGFAWGPQGGGEPIHIAAIEFAVTAGQGGKGSVWIDGLELWPRPVVTGEPAAIEAVADSPEGGPDPSLVLDGNLETWWVGNGRPAQITFDFNQMREFGGVTLVWAPDRFAPDYTLEFSDDGQQWKTAVQVAGSNGGRDHLYLPESESAWLRVKWEGDAALAEMILRPLAWSSSRNEFFMNIAQEARRGTFPRGFLDEPTAWTVVGVDHDAREGLLGSSGALEVGPGEFSLEPFLWAGDDLVTWNEALAQPFLAEGDLPLPGVIWTSDHWKLTISTAGVGQPGQSAILARYDLENLSAEPDSATLYLAVRPFQVNPPVQFLNVHGGSSPVNNITFHDQVITVNGRERVHLMDRPAAFGASTFFGGDIVADHLVSGHLPTAQDVEDPMNAASAAVAYPLILPAGAMGSVELLVPLHAVDEPILSPAKGEIQLQWREKLDRVQISGPASAHDAIATMRTQLGAILVNRAEQRIQPGARSYARSWIRDEALTGVALLRLGHAPAVREFLEWYAPHQYENGKIPCVVDWRGADPVPEHDSTGEFIYLTCEYYRYTGDQDFLRTMWPRVLRGVSYLEELLAQRLTDDYRKPENQHFYGILPPSISHEGYSAKPMHSYWDNFFALRGLKDAAWLAQQLQAEQEQALVRLRDRFAQDLEASVLAAMAVHGIDYIPGCADLGDFDATSTTIALDPAEAWNILPEGALEATFQRYFDFFQARKEGEPWDAFTPYEIRNIGAFVRLGWRERAGDLLDFFLAHRTPIGWRQWGEVVGSDPHQARFIGDMPHTWVGSDYIRSFLDMFAHERRDRGAAPSALVLAAGLPVAWLDEGGVQVEDLPTPYGFLSYALSHQDGEVVMTIAGGFTPPPGGLVLDPPGVGRLIEVKGDALESDPRGMPVVHHIPVTVRWALP